MSTNDKEHGGYVERVRGETHAYVQKILRENEMLRGVAAELDGEAARLREELRIIRDELSARDEKQSELDQKLADIRAESEQYLAQYAQLEQHNANLANLYVASYQLHGTLDRQNVVTAMEEIVVNLIGSEEFAIVERTDDGEFAIVTSIGVDDPAGLHLRHPEVAQVVETGELWIRGGDDTAASPVTACIPLKLDGRVTGHIAIFRLLAHKQGLEPLDHELFDLLATHAATALYCTSLADRLRSERAVA